MLGTSLLAFATFDAVGRFSRVLRMYHVIPAAVPILMLLFCVHIRKQIRDGNLFRASGNTVAAGSTGNQILRPEYLTYLMDSHTLFLG